MYKAVLLVIFFLNVNFSYSQTEFNNDKIPSSVINAYTETRILEAKHIKAAKDIEVIGIGRDLVGIVADQVSAGRIVDNVAVSLQRSINYELDNETGVATRSIIYKNLENGGEINYENTEMLLSTSGINREQYPIIHRNVILGMVNEQKRVNQRINQLEDELGSKEQAVAKFKEEYIQNEKEIQQKQDATDDELFNLSNATEGLKDNLNNLEAESQKKFLTLQNGIKTFQDSTFQILEKNNQIINSHNTKIEENFKEIGELKRKAVEMKDEILLNKVNINQLNKLVTLNRGLIAENTMRIDVMGSVLYEQASTSGKIKLVESGALKVKDKDETLKDLKYIQGWEEFNNNLANGGEIVQFAKNMGIADEKTVKDANNILKGLGLISSFATAAGPMGWIGAANGAFAAFGGPTPGPDPDLLAIKEGIEEIKEGIKEINLKVDDLREKQYKYHIENLKQFRKLHEGIEEIKEIQLFTVELLLNDADCAGLGNEFFGDAISGYFEQLDNLKEIKQLNNILESATTIPFTEALNCIEKNTNSFDLISNKYIIGDTRFTIEALRPLGDYFKHYFKNDDNGFHTLNEPGLYYDTWRDLVDIIPIEKKYESENLFKAYINPAKIATLSDAYMSTYRFNFFRYGTVPGDVPVIMTSEDFNNLEPYIIDERIKGVIAKLKTIEKLMDYAIIQQSLTSGNKLLALLYEDLAFQSDLQNLAFEVVEKNQLMKLNLSNYILHKEILNDATKSLEFERIYSKSYSVYELDDEELESLNSLTVSKWSFKQKKVGDFFELFIYYKTDSDKESYFPIDYEKAKSEQIIYPTFMETILPARQKVRSKIIEFENQLNYNKNN